MPSFYSKNSSLLKVHRHNTLTSTHFTATAIMQIKNVLVLALASSAMVCRLRIEFPFFSLVTSNTIYRVKPALSALSHHKSPPPHQQSAPESALLSPLLAMLPLPSPVLSHLSSVPVKAPFLPPSLLFHHPLPQQLEHLLPLVSHPRLLP